MGGPSAPLRPVTPSSPDCQRALGSQVPPADGCPRPRHGPRGVDDPSMSSLGAVDALQRPWRPWGRGSVKAGAEEPPSDECFEAPPTARHLGGRVSRTRLSSGAVLPRMKVISAKTRGDRSRGPGQRPAVNPRGTRRDMFGAGAIKRGAGDPRRRGTRGAVHGPLHVPAADTGDRSGAGPPGGRTCSGLPGPRGHTSHQPRPAPQRDANEPRPAS